MTRLFGSIFGGASSSQDTCPMPPAPLLASALRVSTLPMTTSTQIRALAAAPVGEGGFIAYALAGSSLFRFESETEQWTPLGSAPAGIAGVFCLLPDGRLLLAATSNTVPSTYIYDPTTGTSSMGPDFPEVTVAARAVLLEDGPRAGQVLCITPSACHYYLPNANAFDTVASFSVGNGPTVLAPLSDSRFLAMFGANHGVFDTKASMWEVPIRANPSAPGAWSTSQALLPVADGLLQVNRAAGAIAVAPAHFSDATLSWSFDRTRTGMVLAAPNTAVAVRLGGRWHVLLCATASYSDVFLVSE